MSDFDREAERKRLREKYEQDREKRESTQRMSELLLQGATMTNRHCETCSDPIFRYDGQEFCPSCQAAAQADANGSPADTGEQEAATGTVEAEPETETNTGDVPESDAPTSVENTDDGERSTPERPVEEVRPTTDVDVDRSPTTAKPATTTGGDGQPPAEPDHVEAVTRRQSARSTRTSGSNAGDVGAARDSLVRTLTRMASAAEEVDDPRRAREYLAAAREAAEAVAALDGR